MKQLISLKTTLFKYHIAIKKRKILKFAPFLWRPLPGEIDQALLKVEKSLWKSGETPHLNSSKTMNLDLAPILYTERLTPLILIFFAGA